MTTQPLLGHAARSAVFAALMVRAAVAIALLAGVMFTAAGRLDLPFVWAFIALHVLGFVGVGLAVDPELLRERMRPGPGVRDRWLRWIVFGMALVSWCLSGLDIGRFHWSDTVPAGMQVAAFGGLLGVFVLSVWTMRTNRFFSSVVRIQEERGHHLVTGGPYAFVRHPGYLAAVCMFPLCGLVLGSWLAVGLAAPMAAMILRRTWIEDRYLHAHLAGYRDYAARVRYRLVPGIW